MTILHFSLRTLIAFVCLSLVIETTHSGERADSVYYVSPEGTDVLSRDGRNQPWRSIGFALANLPIDKSATLIVMPGDYPRVSTTRPFKHRITIQAVTPHQSVILPGEENGPVLFNGASNISLTGFVIDNRNNPSVSNALHLLADSSGIHIQDCIITHGDSGYVSADAVKIHRGVHHILLEGNRIYDGHDEEIDISDGVHDVILRRNVIYRERSISTEAMLSIDDLSHRIVLDGNLFANLNPECQHGTVRLGGGIEHQDDTSEHAIVNNAFVNTAGQCAVAFAGCRDVLLTNNVFYSHRTGGNFFASYRLYPEANSIPAERIFSVNNLFFQPEIVNAFTWYPPSNDNREAIARSHNTYWCPDPGGIPQTIDEPGASVSDPKLLLQNELKNPPSLEWFDSFQLAPTSLAIDSGIALDKLDLPSKLHRLTQDYYSGNSSDPWYQETAGKGFRDAFGNPRNSTSDRGIQSAGR